MALDFLPLKSYLLCLLIVMASVTKKSIESQRAPKAIGPYSQAVRVGNFLFVSGQVALNPKDSSIVGQDVESQIMQIFENVKNLLEDAGTSLENVVKTTLYLKDMGDFAKANEAYSRYFKAPYPARATVQVARLPKDALVEIEAIAVYPS